MTFKAVIHREPEGGYWGEAPALMGCLEVLQEEGRSPNSDVE
jgi:predicted RNase H-like HicB family nuclease